MMPYRIAGVALAFLALYVGMSLAWLLGYELGGCLPGWVNWLLGYPVACCIGFPTGFAIVKITMYFERKAEEVK